jgi:hypothetical protein
VSECDREVSVMRRQWPNGGCCARGENCYAGIAEGSARKNAFPTAPFYIFILLNVNHK